MNRIFVKAVLDLVALPIMIISLIAGPNKNAVISIDQNAQTKRVDDQCVNNGLGSSVTIAVNIKNAELLSGFMVRLHYDNEILKFVKAEKVLPGKNAVPFLERNGGVPGPFLAIPVGKDDLDVTTAVKSADGVDVKGDGTLAYVTFKRLTHQKCSIKVSKAELSNHKLEIDKIISE
mgnify:CR=1 FL=1